MSVTANGVEPVQPAQIQGQGIPEDSAELDCPFLCSIGLVVEEKAGRFKPTPVAMQFINTQLADESRGRRLLRSVIEKTWFGKTGKNFQDLSRTTEYRPAELAEALASAAGVQVQDSGSALAVLHEYLVYTGIVRHELPRTSGARATAVERSSSEPPAPTSGLAGSESTWESIETTEFSLKIRPDLAAIKRLRIQLDLLDQKVRQSSKSRRRK